MKTFLYQESEFSMDNQMAWRSELPMMNIINMTLKIRLWPWKISLKWARWLWMTLNLILKTLDTLFLKIDIQIFVFPFIPSFSFYQSLLEKMIEDESQSLWCHQLVKQEFKSSLFYILSYILISESTWRILLKFAE